jgi:predicted esterase
MKWAGAVALGLLTVAAACTSGSTDSNDGTRPGGQGGSSSGGPLGGGTSGGSSGAAMSSGSASSGAGNGTGSGSGASFDSGAFADSGPAQDDAGTDSTVAADTGAPEASGDGIAVSPPPEVAGCGGAKLYQVPDDPAASGPWPVGVKTVSIALPSVSKPLTVEIWYPAKLGTEAGMTRVKIDARTWLPASEQTKIPDSAAQTSASCNCYRDLPIDDAHGPYPAALYIHGTGSFRYASVNTMTQWASRGFIVVAADHFGLYLADFLASASLGSCQGSGISQDLNRDVDAMIAALTTPAGDLAFLGHSIDMTRIAISGHSQGAWTAAQMSTKPNVQVDLPLDDSSQTVASSSSLKSVMIVAGLADKVLSYSMDQSAYGGSPAPKRLVGITGGGHLVVTDLCTDVNSQGKNAIQVAQQYNVCGVGLLAALFDCGTVDPVAGTQVVNYATTAALEETLHCIDRSQQFSQLVSSHPLAGDFQHSP